MSTWLWVMAASSAVIFALYGLRCARAERIPALRKNAWPAALLGFVFSAAFGTVIARGGYALLTQELDFEYDGIGALAQLLEFDYDCLSFLGGALGVFLGVLLANRLTRKGSVMAGMDAFAPFGALLTAAFRLGELFFGSYGAGRRLPDGSAFAFFPFAVEIRTAAGYSYWAWNICMLSAVFALAWAVFSFLKLRGGTRTGLALTSTLFCLALPQVFCESLRGRGIRWLFVHTEELLCVVVLAVILLVWILQLRPGLSFPRRWWPLGVLVLGIGLLVGIEFAIDGKYFSLSITVSYLLMLLVLAGIGLAGAAAAKRWNAEKP